MCEKKVRAVNEALKMTYIAMDMPSLPMVGVGVPERSLEEDVPEEVEEEDCMDAYKAHQEKSW